MEIHKTIDKGDTILTKEGKEMRVLRVFQNGKDIQRLECVDDTTESPMRTTVFANNISRVLKKAPKPDIKPQGPIYDPNRPNLNTNPNLKK